MPLVWKSVSWNCMCSWLFYRCESSHACHQSLHQIYNFSQKLVCTHLHSLVRKLTPWSMPCFVPVLLSLLHCLCKNMQLCSLSPVQCPLHLVSLDRCCRLKFEHHNLHAMFAACQWMTEQPESGSLACRVLSNACGPLPLLACCNEETLECHIHSRSLLRPLRTCKFA